MAGKWDSLQTQAMYLAAFSVTALPLVVVGFAFTQMSPFAATLIQFLMAVPQAVRAVLAGTTVLFGASLWLSRSKLPEAFFWVAWWALVLLSVASGVLLAPDHPCLAVPALILVGPVQLYPLRRLYKHVGAADWCHVQFVATAGTATTALVVWLFWIIVGFHGSRQHWTDWTPTFRTLVLKEKISWKLAFVCWTSLLGTCVELGVLSVVYWVKSHYLRMHIQEERDTFIGFWLKQLLGWLVALVMLVWLGAAINAVEEHQDMRDETVYLAFWAFVFLGLWITGLYGDDTLTAVMGQSKVFNEALSILQSEWVKATVLLVGAVPMLLYAGAYLAYARVRGAGGQPWPLIETLSHWHWTAALVKACWLGLIYVFMLVMLGKAMLLALAVTNETISAWPVFAVSAALFCIGFVIFLFPSAPAAPVYVLMGLVIEHSAHHHGWRFGTGLAWACFVTFAMKLAFTVAAQKCIGELLADSPMVRQCIGIHTPYMRAVEEILTEQVSVAKVTLLIGGPDWPVAVLCGILRLPLLPILVGISPVLLQSIVPCVLSGALLFYKSGHPGVPPLETAGLADASLLIAGVLQFATALVAFLCVQEVLERDYDRLSRPRQEDAWLKELDERDEARHRWLQKETCWRQLPAVVWWPLVAGFAAMEASMALLTGPWHDIAGVSCFRRFDLMMSVGRELGGNPFAIVLPLGWVAFGLAALSGVLLVPYYVLVSRLEAKHAADEELAPLLPPEVRAS